MKVRVRTISVYIIFALAVAALSFVVLRIDDSIKTEGGTLCPPQEIADIDFGILNTETRPALEKNSVAWKMLGLGDNESLIVYDVSTAFLNAFNVPLSNIPEWFIEMRDGAILQAESSGEPVGYGFLNDALDRFVEDPKYSHYADPEQKFKLFVAVNEGFIKATGDPFAVYVSPRQIELGALSYSGTFFGIGASIGPNHNNEWELSAIMEGGPAERAGLQKHDILRLVDGKSVEGCVIGEIIGNIRGKENTRVRLSLERNDEELEVSVVRGEIKLEAVQPWPSLEWPDGRGSSGKSLSYQFPLKTRGGVDVPDIAYIKLGDFNTQAVKDFYYTLEHMPWVDISGLIVDLRNNLGGLLYGAGAITGYFLPPGAVIFYQRNSDGKLLRYVNSVAKMEHPYEKGVYFVPDLVPSDMPVVVLLNKYTASAAEIFAGALQDYGRAWLVGERTTGKGTINIHVILKDKKYGALYIATDLWETPSNRFIEPLHETEEGGLLPDVVIEQPIRGFEPDNDENIFRALEILMEN